MSRIEHIRTQLASVEDRVSRLRALIDHPNFDRLPAIECELLQDEFVLMHRVAKNLRARLELAERIGAQDVLELRELGLEEWLTI